MTSWTGLDSLPQSGAALLVANSAPAALETAVRQQRPALQLLGNRVFTLDRRESLLSALHGGSDVPVIPCHVDASEIRAGKPVGRGKLHEIGAAADRLAYLEWRIAVLSRRTSIKQDTAKPLARPRLDAGLPEPVAPAVPPGQLALEVDALRPDGLLASSGGLEVFLASPARIPGVLREIGRLREIAFRAAGEGTGQALDLDRFDDDYLHLFVWNPVKREIAGAYRLSSNGVGAGRLYTATLFHYGAEFLERTGPALELGRSFIRLEYQRGFAPLLLLWKGIGRYVSGRPEYKILFGPVSISNQYSALSRELMIAFLERREWLAGLAGLVRARRPPTGRPAAEHCRDLDDLSDVVSDLEPGARGVPILLRQYLRLGGKLLGFNVDPDFSNSLDGLILVDLTRTDPRLLDRYFGAASAAQFLSYWKGNHGNFKDSQIR